MATAEIGHNDNAHNEGAMRGAMLRWLSLAALLGIGVILATRLDLGRPSVRANEVSHPVSITEAHCAQFIAIAKAAYGANWKYRLDPRDTTCAAEVQAQWQHEWTERQPTTPLPSGTMSVNQPTTPIEEPSTEATDAGVRSPETYCLNVISLARSRYGADWAARVTPEDMARCGDAVRAAMSH